MTREVDRVLELIKNNVCMQWSFLGWDHFIGRDFDYYNEDAIDVMKGMMCANEYDSEHDRVYECKIPVRYLTMENEEILAEYQH